MVISLELIQRSIMVDVDASDVQAAVLSIDVTPKFRIARKMTAAAKELKRTLFRDGFNYFLSKIIPGLMGFLSVLVFVRLLGVEQYGRYAVVFAFVMAWASGLSGWLARECFDFKASGTSRRTPPASFAQPFWAPGYPLLPGLFFSGSPCRRLALRRVGRWSFR